MAGALTDEQKEEIEAQFNQVTIVCILNQLVKIMKG